jgi:hypothetical protein
MSLVEQTISGGNDDRGIPAVTFSHTRIFFVSQKNLQVCLEVI